MRVLVFSSLFPNTAQPRHGIFTEHRVCHMVDSGHAEVRVVAPVPWFPLKGGRFGKYGAYAQAPRLDERHGIHVAYPRYPVLPKVGMNIAPFLLAGAMVKPLKRLVQGGFDFDIIDAYYFYPDGVAAALLGQVFHKPVVITAYGSDINVLAKHTLPARMIQWASRQAAGMTTVCQALKTGLVELGAPESAVRVILHGVDQQLFSPPEDRDALRRRLGFTRKTLLSVGRLVELKGHHIVIQALTQLADTDLVIAGDGEEEKTLKRLTASLKVADRVRFLGQLDQARLCDYYGAADAFVLASSREGIPNVLLESMACGTPVVVTSVGGAPEVITAPAAGLLISERTPQAVVNAVHRLFSDFPERGATRQFVTQFSWTRTTEQHLAVLNDIVSLGPGDVEVEQRLPPSG